MFSFKTMLREIIILDEGFFPPSRISGGGGGLDDTKFNSRREGQALLDPPPTCYTHAVGMRFRAVPRPLHLRVLTGTERQGSAFPLIPRSVKDQ